MKSKVQKVDEGRKRQAERDKLTVAEKIRLCKSRRGESKREMTKLMAMLP